MWLALNTQVFTRHRKKHILDACSPSDHSGDDVNLPGDWRRSLETGVEAMSTADQNTIFLTFH